MSAQKITFPNKNDGDLFTSTEVNSIKNAINSHASDIDSLTESLGDLDDLSLSVQGLETRESLITKQETSVDGIVPGPLYLWSQPVASLELNKTSGSEAMQNEYKLQFTVSGSNFALTGSLFQDVRWMDEPDWEDGFTYQVSILNGLAIYAGWEAVQS